MTDNIKVAFYGCGNFAQKTRIPNVLKTGAQIVGLSDTNVESLKTAKDQCPNAKIYEDAHQMLKDEKIDVLYSIVPAFVRTDIEITAAQKGIHIFSEKPQVMEMALGKKIETAILDSGVLSTVGVRERYRPLFQEAREWLKGKKIVHARFQSISGLPPFEPASWWDEIDKSGGSALDWGIHATDYLRYLTTMNIKTAQAFYHHPSEYTLPLSSSIHYCFSSGATASLLFVKTAGEVGSQGMPAGEPWFKFFCEEGVLSIHGYESLLVDGDLLYEAKPFDPWEEQDRVFIEAVRNRDTQGLLSDYSDGLHSLGPVLAAWHSAKHGGEAIDVESFIEQ